MTIKSVEMFASSQIQDNGDLGKNDFKPKFSKLEGSKKWLVGILIGLFIAQAFLADLWPCKNIPLGYGWPVPRSNTQALAMSFKINSGMRYSTGDNCHSFISLPYVALVKLSYNFIPYRLLCLRVISTISTAIALFFLYRLAAILFSPAVGIVYLFLLATSPVYLEKMRSFGFIPLSNAVVAIACYLLAASFNNKNIILKITMLSLCCFLTLSLYASSRLIIVFVVVFFLIYYKNEWKKLALFLFLFISLILISDQICNDIHYDPIRLNSLTYPERLPLGNRYMETIGKQSIVGALADRLLYNIRIVGYYFSLNHEKFYNEDDQEWENPDRIFNLAYLPFFFLGLAVCLWKREKSNIFLLLWFILFFLVLFLSGRIHVRRILFGLSPTYLLIALGLWAVFRFLVYKYRRRKCYLVIISLSLAFLGMVGSYNVFQYFYKYARPYYNYSKDQLHRLAAAISENGKAARAIRYNRPSEVLIWGNPYFDGHFIDLDIVNKLEVESKDLKTRKIRPTEIKEQIEYAIREGGDVLYLHTFLKPDPGAQVQDGGWSYLEIEEVKEEFRGKIEVSQVPGIKEVYFVYVKGTQDNL